MPNVTITRVPGRPRQVTVPEGATVNDAILEAGLLSAVESEGFQPRAGGQRVDLASTVEEGAVITLVQQVKGND